MTVAARSRRIPRCDRCGLPGSLCLCADLPRVPTTTELVVLMHKTEIGKSSNTGRLALAVLERARRSIRGREGVAPEIPPAGRRLVLFPMPGARELTPSDAQAPLVLVVPDGSWSQARRMIDRQGIPPGDVPAIFRYHAEQCAAAIGGIALIAGIWAFSWPSSTSSTHGDFARFGPLLLIPAFGIAMLLTMRNRKPARLAMWEAGVRLCMECGHDMAPDSMHRCPACTWLDAQRAPELDGRVSPNLSSPGRFRTALKVGPLTLLLLPELKEARLRELAPKVLYGRSPHYLAELLCVPCLMVIVAGIAGFVALASAPAGTPSALAILLRSSLPVVLLSVLAFWNLRYCRRMLRSARRLAGQRLCRKCGYEMTMLGSFQCPECGWIDRLRAPRDEKPAEST